MHIARGLYYGSYKAPRVLLWAIGVIILIVMMATAFLGYVLPYGQMSLWGQNKTFLLLMESCQLLSINNKTNSKLLENFIGLLDGDGYIEIGPQKQSNSKSTIRVRIVLRLQKEDKELLNLFSNTLKIGKIDELKNINQYRLIISKTEIFNIIYPILKNSNIEFLIYNRRKQFFLRKNI